MTLPVDRIVEVNISTSPLALARAGFGIFNLFGTGDVIPITERTRSYDNIDGVAEDWATTTEEYKAASIYFSQSPRPTSLLISRRLASAVPEGQIVGGQDIGTLAAFQAITDGSFKFAWDDNFGNGGTETISGLNFSAATDLDDVAAVIDAGLVAVNFSADYTYESSTDNFKLVLTPNSGYVSELGAFEATGAGTDISTLVQMTASTAALIDTGGAAETISDTLNASEAINSSWYGFGFTSEVRDNSQTSAGTILDCLDAAAWAEARIKVFMNNSSDLNTRVSTNTTNIMYQLQQLNYGRTLTAFSEDDYPSLSVFSRGATVDFEGTDTTITYMFKQLPGITVSVLSASQANAITGFNGNYYTPFGTKASSNSAFIFVDGRMADGTFFDEVVGIDWLQDAIQTSVFNALYKETTKIPQTNDGVARLITVAEQVLQQGVNNGLVAPGEVSDVFLAKGYEVFATAVEDQNQSDREAREAPPIGFVAKGAGAIHKVVISGTFVR